MMYEHTLPIQLLGQNTIAVPISKQSSGLITKEYEYWHTLLSIQPVLQKQIVNQQGYKLADALFNGLGEVSITIPDMLLIPINGDDQQEAKTFSLVEASQRLSIKKRRGWFIHETLLEATRKQLSHLEASSNMVKATFGGLLRFTTARSLIHDCLPAGKEMTYANLPGEDVPSVPQDGDMDKNRSSAPEIAYANRFYLPQWIAFGENGQLMTGMIGEAEACIVSMQQYLETLNGAVTLAPYMVVDPVYQQKYFGILGQFVNQSRAFCRYRTQEIITTIRRRSTFHNLNRGLRVTMPYFDDQDLLLRKLEFEIIPPGRVMFLPAFVVLAVQAQINLARHNTGLNSSTRKHLLSQLMFLEKTFDREIN
ncbi:MAG: hypothetical protein JW908_11300 [Anaerolineales bacterium]|nr:hypothetical protein [Anaerolineales bacterium]